MMQFRSLRPATGASRRPGFRPSLERLEDRCLLSAGDPDLTFGTGGMVSVAGMDFRAVTVQPGDGKIVVAGSVDASYVVARFNTDGSLDDGGPNDLTPGDAFGQGGMVQMAGGGHV